MFIEMIIFFLALGKLHGEILASRKTRGELKVEIGRTHTIRIATITTATTTTKKKTLARNGSLIAPNYSRGPS